MLLEVRDPKKEGASKGGIILSKDAESQVRQHACKVVSVGPTTSDHSDYFRPDQWLILKVIAGDPIPYNGRFYMIIQPDWVDGIMTEFDGDNFMETGDLYGSLL